MIGFESDRDPMPEKKTELANWISPGSLRSYNPARQKRALRDICESNEQVWNLGRNKYCLENSIFVPTEYLPAE